MTEKENSLAVGLTERVKKSTTLWVVIIACLVYINMELKDWLKVDGVPEAIQLQVTTFLMTVFSLYLGKEGLRLGFGNRK